MLMIDEAILARAHKWLNGNYDDDIKTEIQKLIESGHIGKLEEVPENTFIPPAVKKEKSVKTGLSEAEEGMYGRAWASFLTSSSRICAQRSGLHQSSSSLSPP